MSTLSILRRPVALLLAYLVVLTTTWAQSCAPDQILLNGQCTGLVNQELPPLTPETRCRFGGNRWDAVNQYCVIEEHVTRIQGGQRICVQSPHDLVFPDFGSSDLEQVAADGINRYLAGIGRPQFPAAACGDSSSNLFRLSQPETAAAAVFVHLSGLMQKSQGQLRDYEQRAVAAFAGYLKNRDIVAAEVALGHYRAWMSDPCSYRPPAGFTYDPPAANFCSNSGNLGNMLVSADQASTPPDFVQIGLTVAYPTLVSPRGSMQSVAVSSLIYQLIGGYLGGTAAGGLTPMLAEFKPMAATRLHNAIWPHILENNKVLIDTTLSVAERAGNVLSVAGRLAGPAGILASTVLDIIFATLDIVKDAKRGEKLRDGLERAKTQTVDLGVLITTEKGIERIYSLFSDAVNLRPVLLGYTSSTAGSADFTLTGTNYATLDGQKSDLTYRTWDNTPWRAEFNWDSGRFIHTNTITGSSHDALVMNYVNWEGLRLQAQYDVNSGVFVVRGYPMNITALTDTLHVRDEVGLKRRYTLNNRGTGKPGGLWRGPAFRAWEIRSTTDEHLETSTMFRAPATAMPARWVLLSGSAQMFGELPFGSQSVMPFRNELRVFGPILGAEVESVNTWVFGTPNLQFQSSRGSGFRPQIVYRDTEGNLVNGRFQ